MKASSAWRAVETRRKYSERKRVSLSSPILLLIDKNGENGRAKPERGVESEQMENERGEGAAVGPFAQQRGVDLSFLHPSLDAKFRSRHFSHTPLGQSHNFPTRDGDACGSTAEDLQNSLSLLELRHHIHRSADTIG